MVARLTCISRPGSGRKSMRRSLVQSGYVAFFNLIFDQYFYLYALWQGEIFLWPLDCNKLNLRIKPGGRYHGHRVRHSLLQWLCRVTFWTNVFWWSLNHDPIVFTSSSSHFYELHFWCMYIKSPSDCNRTSLWLVRSTVISFLKCCTWKPRTSSVDIQKRLFTSGATHSCSGHEVII